MIKYPRNRSLQPITVAQTLACRAGYSGRPNVKYSVALRASRFTDLPLVDLGFAEQPPYLTNKFIVQ